MKKQFSLNEFLELIDSLPNICEEYNFCENYIEYRPKNECDFRLRLDIPKIFHSQEPAYPSRIKQEHVDAMTYMILIVRAGAAIIAVCRNDEIIKYKMIKKL